MTAFDQHLQAAIRIERRQRLMARLGLTACAALITLAALWNSPAITLDGILQAWHRWAAPSQPHEARLPTRAPPVVTAALPKSQRAVPITKALPGSDSSVSVTPQPLLLTGTMAGRNPLEGFAMIGVDSGNPQAYAAGALLANGTRLKEIYARYVVLEKAGHSARLYLMGSEEEKSHRGAASDLVMVGGPAKAPPAVATSWEAYTDYVVPNPVFNGSSITGYQVYPGKVSGPFFRMGLKPGDVITAVDGASLIEDGQSVEIFRSLTDGNSHIATVSRQGGSSEISLDGSLIATELAHRTEIATSPRLAGGATVN